MKITRTNNVKLFTAFFILICACLILILQSCTQKNSNKKPIKIALNIWAGYGVAFIAQEKGFYKKNNVEVELLLNSDISDSKQLFKNGDVDGLFGTFSDNIMLNVAGIDSSIVWIADDSIGGDVIICKPDIDSVNELKDKTISFEGINSFSNYFVIKIIEQNGLSESDVRFANINAMDVLKALENNEIDAGHTWEPVTSEALSKGYKILAKSIYRSCSVVDTLSFREDIILNRKEDIYAVIRSLNEADNFMRHNTKEAYKIIAEKMKVSFKSIKTGISNLYIPTLQEQQSMMSQGKPNSLFDKGYDIIKFYMNRGQILETPDLNKIINPSFIDSLLEKKK